MARESQNGKLIKREGLCQRPARGDEEGDRDPAGSGDSSAASTSVSFLLGASTFPAHSGNFDDFDGDVSYEWIIGKLS